MKKMEFSERYHLTEAVIEEIKTHTRRIKRSVLPPNKRHMRQQDMERQPYGMGGGIKEG